MTIWASIGAWLIIIPMIICKFVVDWRTEIEYRVRHLGANEKRLKKADFVMVISCFFILMIPFYVTVINPILTIYREYF